MAKQMNEEERKRLDVLLGMGLTPAEAAQRLGRPKSTVVREIIKRAVPCLRGYGSSNRVCASYDYCTRTKGYGGNPRRLFRCTAGCFEACPEFVGRHGEPGRLFLGRLGLRRIPPSEVILDPYLLGKRFERLAAKAILRKNGVPTTPGAAART